ncbi:MULTISPECIES: hypothetical protein [unclassified Variovorax]|uniref:hypothetical protein n=1 Tax=unclassified Variovorax TaxID=663243 RepID=UPI00076C43B4|nr:MULTISPECIES: hypothetical protein [unclassified Variovorax]KWT81210.1 hypothetical protein APY03_5027 [Variovorax sp. WDL1]PNG48918.1 hypothetical protein CHC07_06708 [Variovorax sp. B4]PNG49774.1 hypothetical protein CHC06_05355 [Variovorax sp. B2]PNG50621.1 hypothetical protein CHC06_06245 [Variovorax sp. B2]VTV17814.1 hypothetical protein WDL1P1_00680 [Variovorax sp. WDL1]
MKTIATALICASIAFATGGASAQDTTKKNDSMAKDGTKSSMTMQECKAHMEMSKKGEMKKDDPMMKMCADMMKKDGKAGASTKK